MTNQQRFLVHTTTDKPIYKRKDTVYIRATFLNAIDQTPIHLIQEMIQSMFFLFLHALFPEKSKKYHLNVTKPNGITKPIDLPIVQNDGVSLISLNDVYSNDLSFKISATKKGEYQLKYS